jgi:4-hydroxybenzoate polyprenyltransferase
VWSNCLAAWLLGGGGSWDRFAILCAGATLLYTGGMFLNDAFDVEFDRKYRPERPIITGRITAKCVWILGASWLLVGLALMLPLGAPALSFASVLTATIVTYDAIHKRTALAPLLMAACRFLLYLLAASAALCGAVSAAVWPGLALALYILGLSYLARRESTGGLATNWPAVLLGAPIVASLVAGAQHGFAVGILAIAQGLWVLRCLFGDVIHSRQDRKPNIAGLLAGIVLVDTLATAAQGHRLGPAFVGLFLLALLLQRFAPAT